MVLRSVIRGSAALLAVSISLTVGVFAFAGPQRWIPLTEAEMAGHRGSNAQRGKFTDNCTHFQAINGQGGNWSCIGDADNTGCRKCQVTTDITYADMGGDPKNQTDGNAQNCGPVSSGALCQAQVCTGDTWSTMDTCAQPRASVTQQ